jgi:hypothetical protein
MTLKFEKGLRSKPSLILKARKEKAQQTEYKQLVT